MREQSADKLAKLQRKIARAVKGSNNRKAIKDKIAKLHKRINCQRDDFLHKLSRTYVNNFDIICVEDLDVKGLKEKGHNNGMHRSIHDASWSKFIFMLSYKAQSAGRKLIKVDPRNTTQRCSACGSIVKKDLSVRVHECPYCGFSCDRDYNASRNILIAGMEQPVAPIEPKPLHHISVMQVLAMKWEAAPFVCGIEALHRAASCLIITDEQKGIIIWQRKITKILMTAQKTMPPFSQLDIAPTAALILGLQLPKLRRPAD